MSHKSNPLDIPLLQKTFPLIVLILGICLVIVRGFGPNLGQVPGDLGDARFNNYVLEHFFQWLTGHVSRYWNAPFFYPFPNAIAFSDSLLGSAPFYALFRGLGFDRESAYQGWYALGFIFNFLAATYVLSRLKLHPLAISTGAFFFTFGLPVLAQAGHAQLIYRFGVPLACYFLWLFSKHPQFTSLSLVGFWFVWQLYLSIYIGLFLFLLLMTFIFLLPMEGSDRNISRYLAFWPQKIRDAWITAASGQKAVNIIAIAALALAVYFLFAPYLWVSTHYGFARSWAETATMLPRIQSYFLADGSLLWKQISLLFSVPSMRAEHQLFPGVGITLLILTGLLWRSFGKNTRSAHIHWWAICFLVEITLSIGELSLYKIFFYLPGFNSIRAVTRIMLVMMWPMTVFIAIVMDRLMAPFSTKFPSRTLAVLCFLFLACESIFFTQMTYSKADGRNRINELHSQLPSGINNETILVVASNNKDPWWVTEIDAMLLSQELGINTLNGYSGNFPLSYGDPTISCKQVRRRISQYLKFSNTVSDQNYYQIAKRVIPIGFTDCNP